MNIIKILISIIAFLIFFDKLFLSLILLFYYLYQKYILKKNIENPIQIIKKYINPKKRVEYYLENINNINNKFGYTLLNSKKENMQNFDPSNVIANNYLPNSLSNVFKHNNMNFNHYPYVEIKPDEPIFKNNKILPECCLYNNEYSTDRGCPCITPDQQYYLQRRGINKDKDNVLINSNNSNNNNNSNSNNSNNNIYFSPSLAIKGEQFPFNPVTSTKYNINYVGNPPEQLDTSLNEFYLMTNFISHSIERKI